MTITPFLLGILTCLAAQGAIFALSIVAAAFVAAVRQSPKPKVFTQIISDIAPDGQK